MNKLLIPLVMIVLGVASLASGWGAPSTVGELPCAAGADDESALISDDGCVISESALQEWRDDPPSTVRWDRIIGTALIVLAIPTLIALFVLARRSGPGLQLPPPPASL